MELLKVENLTLSLNNNINIVKNISLKVMEGEFISIIGESGSGKTLTSLAIAGILPPPIRITSGKIYYSGKEMVDNKKSLKQRDGISMVFQNSMSSLNPLMKIGPQVSESITGNGPLNLKENRQRVLDTLKKVGLGRPEKIYDSYPHELSGGMRQRIGIAMAIIDNPKLLILDEPTTALDVTTQAQVLNLIRDLRESVGISAILISHDLSVVRENSDRIYIIYGGELMEENSKSELFLNPLHPYTEGLLNSVVSVQRSLKPFFMLKGSLDRSLKGCIFSNRCPKVMDICRHNEPPLIIKGNARVKCHLYGGDK